MPEFMDPMHLVRLAALESALLALLNEAKQDLVVQADEITATLDSEGMHIAYLEGGNEIGGEGV